MKREQHLQFDKSTLLREILATLQSIDRKLEGTRRPTLSRSDREALDVLLPEVAAAIGNTQWTVSELLEHAHELDPPLLGAIEDACGTVDDGLTRRLGKFFARAAGFTIRGHRLERSGETREGVVLWSVHAA